jgi:hypothetical protein
VLCDATHILSQPLMRLFNGMQAPSCPAKLPP